MKKIIENIKKKWIRDTVKTTIMIIILFAVFIGINVVIQKLDLQDIDITQNQLFTLSEISKKQVQNIEKEVTIYLIGFDGENSLSDLAKQYTQTNDKIKTETIENIETRADLKSKYNITDETQVIIIETDENSKILTTDDLYTYDYTTYQQIDISEEKLTNAIADLTKNSRPKIYFLTGHNEYNLSNELTMLNAYLINEINDVETLDLLVTGKIPDDTSLIIIGSPTKDFMDQEVEILTNYINQGGKILWMNDPVLSEEKFPNMQKILDLFGASFQDGIILEQDETKMALQSPNYIIPNIATTNATKDIATDGGILLVNATKIKLASDEELDNLNVIPEVILTTSEEALFRTEVTNTTSSKIETDEQGSFILGVKLTKIIEQDENEKQATLYMLSNNFFISDYQVTIGNSKVSPISFYNNKDYILNTIAELTENEDTISIRKDTGVVTYTATEAQDNMIKIAITIFPTAIIIIGIIVWVMRRKKK
ncbi:MAG: GldG family protein [Clostridia bacterium]|nr:GldG family protein [Clostridia bacterium]